MFSTRYNRQQINKLRTRWEGEDARVSAIVADLRAGRDWTKNLLAAGQGEWNDLPMLDTCPRKFRIPWDSAPRDLRGLKLSGIDLARSYRLANACMDLCEFQGVNLRGASLKGSSLYAAEFKSDCILESVSLHFTDMRYCTLSGVSLQKAILTHTDIRGADFEDSVLLDACLSDANFSKERTFGFVIPWRMRKRLRWPRWTRFGGRLQLVDQLKTPTDSPILDYICGENIRWSILRTSPLLGRIWYIISDCGRSPSRLLFWVIAIILFFGFIYAGYSLPGCLQGTLIGDILVAFSPRIEWGQSSQPYHPFDPFYYSIITLTTFGCGNISARLGDWKAEAYIAAEVLLGYVLLSMLISVFLQHVSLRRS